ncbi:MAG: DUF4833 domain-containing protein [Mucilaginibacter sp.]
MKHFFFTIIAILFITTQLHAQDSLKFPTPTGNPNQLFFLQRNQNTNTVVYELNYKKGVLDTVQPVHAFWICYAERSQKEELTTIQKKMAYGLTTKRITENHYELRLAADKNNVLQLMKGPDQKFHVFYTINQREAILNRIYLQIHGGSLFSPNVEYVLFSGADPETGMVIFEKKKRI